MRWLVGIFKQFVGRVVWQIVFAWIKQQLWWAVVVGAVSGASAWMAELGWGFWFFVAMGSFALVMAIRQTWFTKKKPCLVIPEYVRDDRGYEGLRLMNESSCTVLNVLIEPLQIGNQTVEFGGPEVAYLKAKETCFFRLENVPPALLLRNWKGDSILMGVLRKWQKDLGDNWGATIDGRITYENLRKSKGETRFRVRADVEADLGLSVTVI